VTATLRTLVDVLAEDAELGESLRQGLLLLEGDRELARRFETLFAFEEGSGILPSSF
jgi:ubiquinone biosynthesis protein UbiJ